MPDSVISVRVIKNFHYRSIKYAVLHVDLQNTTVGALKDRLNELVATGAGFKPFRSIHYDTLKIYTHAQGTKTMDLAINLDHEEWILTDDHKMLAECDIANETELSYFNMEAYREYQANPVQAWD